MEYSRCGLTRDLYNFSRTSLFLNELDPQLSRFEQNSFRFIVLAGLFGSARLLEVPKQRRGTRVQTQRRETTTKRARGPARQLSEWGRRKGSTVTDMK